MREHRVGLFSSKSTAVRRLLITAGVFLFAPSIIAAESSPTIASTSLCGDTYLQALAPNHISALSWQSRSPLSRATPAQRKLPQLWDNPEILLNTKADIILFGSGEGQYSNNLSAHAIELTWGEDFSNIQINAQLITDALNIAPDISEHWAERINTLKTHADSRAYKPKILYLSRSGGSAGKGTLVDSAITAAGGINAIEEAGWFTPDPEEIIAYKPDLIITSYFKNGYESVQSTAVRNKVVQRYIAKYPNIEIDGKLWPCAGPGLIKAAEQISNAIDTLP